MISNGSFMENRRDNTSNRRRRATSFNHFSTAAAAVPQHSTSTSGGSSRTTHAAEITPMTTQSHGSFLDGAPEHDSVRSLHDRMAQFSLDPPKGDDAGRYSRTTRPSMSQSRLPRRQIVRLSHSKSTTRQQQQQPMDTAEVDQTPGASRSETTLQQHQQHQQQLEPLYEAQPRTNLHSIWVAEEQEDTADEDAIDTQQQQQQQQQHASDTDLYLQLRDTFADILDGRQDQTPEQIIQTLRICLDKRQARIDELESYHATGNRKQFETDKRALLEQQREQFETLKLKYRVGLEQIVDQWLSHEAAEQEQWMDQIQQEAEERVARIEAHWKKRNSLLQKQLERYIPND